MATLHVTLELPEWDDPDEGYRSLQGNITREAVQQLFGEMKNELADTIRTELMEQIRAQVGNILTDVVETPIRKTNAYGEPIGKPVTLRELVMENAGHYLQESVRLTDGTPSSYSSDKPVTRLQYMTHIAVRAELEATFSKRIGQALDEAKAEIDTHLTAMVKDAIKARLKL